MVIRSLLMCCFLAFSIAGFSQRNFLPGVIVLSNGDSLKGLVDYRNWERNPKRISFKTLVDNKTEYYTPKQIKFFRVDNQDAYESVIIWMNTMPTKIVNTDGQEIFGDKKDTVFLRILAEGPILSLYKIIDLRSHFYVKLSTDTLRELRYGMYPLLGNVRVDYTYRKQLQELASAGNNNSRLNNKIKNAQYSDQDLKEIVRMINNSPVVTKSNMPKTKDRIKVILGGGITFNDINFSGANNDLNGLKNNGSPTSYIVNAGLDLYSPHARQKPFFRIELAYSSFAYNGFAQDPDENRTYQFAIQSITPALSFNYALFKREDFSFFLGLGAGFNISSYPKNKMVFENIYFGNKTVQNYLAPEKTWLQLAGRIGANFKKIELLFASRINGTFETYSHINSDFKTSALILSYTL